jgi:hypothetical protein
MLQKHNLNVCEGCITDPLLRPEESPPSTELAVTISKHLTRSQAQLEPGPDHVCREEGGTSLSVPQRQSGVRLYDKVKSRYRAIKLRHSIGFAASSRKDLA